MFVSSRHCGRVLRSVAAALAMAAALCGCGSFDNGGVWFAKPLNLVGVNATYDYSQLSEERKDRPITANDVVDANGACPRFAAPAPMQSASAAADDSGVPAPDLSALLGAGIALGMSECEVVSRLGQPAAVNLGRNPNGDRSAVLTFKSGPRPGVYRFDAGRLMEMDQVEVPPPRTEPAKKKLVKKKPGKNKRPPKDDDKS